MEKTMSTEIKIDLSDLKRELRGIVHQCLNEMLEGLDVKDWIEKRVSKWIKEAGTQIIENKVYAFLEESEIEVPKTLRYSNKKLTLNDYMVRVIHDFAASKAKKILSGMKITLKNENKGLSEEQLKMALGDNFNNDYDFML